MPSQSYHSEHDDEREQAESAAWEDRKQIRTMLWSAIEKLTKKVEILEINFAVMASQSEALKNLGVEFRSLEKSYSEMKGNLKLQGRIFAGIAGFLLTVVAGLIVALVKKP